MKIKHTGTDRQLYDQQADAYLPPPLKSDRAKWRRKRFFFFPGTAKGWLQISLIYLTIPSLVAFSIATLTIPKTVVAVGLGVISLAFITGSLHLWKEEKIHLLSMWTMLAIGIISIAIQYHHPFTTKLHRYYVQQSIRLQQITTKILEN